MRWLLAMMIMAALIGAEAPDTPLTTADLVRAVAEFQKPRADKFTAAPSMESIIGRRFRATSFFPELINAGGPRVGRIGGWTYDPDRQLLTLVPWVSVNSGYELESDPTLKDIKKSFYGFALKTNAHYLGKTTQGNAFGATVQVDQYLGRSVVIGAYKEGFGSYVFPRREGLMDDKGISVSVAPSEARDLTRHLRFFVEGVIKPYAERRVVACGGEMAPATFEHRSETFLDFCLISAQIDRYGVEDDRTGKVLADWRNPNI